jgi:hypothetical protein
MARIRTIKPEFFADEKLGPLDVLTRFVFLGLISMADDMGRVLDNVKQIDAFVFPYTEDSSRGAIELLAEAGRIRRGQTANGLLVIQIVNWHHQKIDKPNFASCLPAIAGDPEDDAARYRRSKRIPERVRNQVWERDKGTCQLCGKTDLRREKKDRYDSDPDLGEIDHRIEAADGGSNSLDNLQLCCLACNRKKAGSARVERSATSPRTVADASAPHTIVPPTIVAPTPDQRSPIMDRGPAGEVPASLFETLPGRARELLTRFYEFPVMTEKQRERYRNVAMQLVDTIDPKHPGPKIRGGQRVKARSVEQLDDVCAAVMRDPPNDRDFAVVFVLKKLLDPEKGPSATQLASEQAAQARSDEDRYHNAAKAAGIEWAEEHPDEYQPILAEVEARYKGKASSFAMVAREAELVTRCAKAAGFPPFEEWIERQQARAPALAGSGR